MITWGFDSYLRRNRWQLRFHGASNIGYQLFSYASLISIMDNRHQLSTSSFQRALITSSPIHFILAKKGDLSTWNVVHTKLFS